MSDTPLHIAIIPDGNRRWAKKQSLSPWKGHEKSAKNFQDISLWCRDDPRVSILTIWCFSTENWKRDPKEVEKLMIMLEKNLQSERTNFMKNNTRLLRSGRTDRLSPSLKKLLEDICEETEDNSGFTTHLLLDYGGKDELLRAMNKLTTHNSQLTTNSQITDEDIRNQLDQPNLPNIDLIIRTSEEKRTSNFNLWQSTYAEWIFHPKLFPDFTTEDLSECIEEYANRTRRFGA